MWISNRPLANKIAVKVAPKTTGIWSLMLDCRSELSTKPEIGLKTSMNPCVTLAMAKRDPTLRNLLMWRPILADWALTFSWQ